MARLEAEVAQMRSQGQKLPKEVLYTYMAYFDTMAAKFQPTIDPERPNTSADPERFFKAVEYVLEFAKAAAPFYSPTFKAMAHVVQPAGGDTTIDLTGCSYDELVVIERTFRKLVAGPTARIEGTNLPSRPGGTDSG